MKLTSHGRNALAKQIQIYALPNCYLTEKLIRMVKDTEATVWVVASLGGGEDWAVYIGHPNLNVFKEEHQYNMMPYVALGLSSAQGTLDRGDKLPQVAADILFPEFAHLRYRR